MCKTSTFLIVLLATMYWTVALSQPCSQEELTKKPGTWKPGLQGSTTGVSAADLAREKEIVAKAFSIIKEGYSPVGCEVSYAGVYGFNQANGKNWVANPYGFSAYFLRYLCDSQKPGQYYVDVSTPTKLNINFNLIEGMYNGKYAADLPDDVKEGFVAIKKLPEYKNGFYFLESDVEYNDKIKEYTWYIFYDNKLPYKRVTKREYLEYLKKNFNEKIEEINANEARMKKTPYYTDDDKKLYAGQREYYALPLQEVEQMLKIMHTEELDEPAIIQSTAGESPIDRFVPEGTKYSRILVKPDLSYYNTGLNRYEPQAISIVLTIFHGDPVFEHVFEHVSKAIDVNKFKALLKDQSQVTYN